MTKLDKKIQAMRREMRELITDHHTIGFRLVALHQEWQDLEVELNPDGEQDTSSLPVVVDEELELEREVSE